MKRILRKAFSACLERQEVHGEVLIRRIRMQGTGESVLKRRLIAVAAAFAGAVWIASAIAAASDAKPAGEFTAMATVETPSGSRRMGLTVIVLRPMRLEEAMPLKKVLAEGGQQALVNAIRGSNRGSFRLGAADYPIDLVVAEPVRDGYTYFIVTARALQYEEVQQGSESLEHPFTVAEFHVPGFGPGDGHVYTKAALVVDEDGHVRVNQYDRRPGTLKDVKRR
jgi:hypothetical protein